MLKWRHTEPWNAFVCPLPCRLFTEIDSQPLHLCINSSNKQLSSICNICWLIQSQGKPLQSFVLFFNWLLLSLPTPSTLPATIVTKRLIVLRKLISSGHIPLAATNKHDLINLLFVNGFPCLVNKCVTQNLTLIAVLSSGTFCCVCVCVIESC